MRWLKLVFVLLIITSCATGPRYDEKIFLKTPSPGSVAENIQATQGNKVLWGGMLINHSLKDQQAQLEILAYPLDDKQKPDTSKVPFGRYLAIKQDYLESMDFTQGRLITTAGTISDVQPGLVGQATLVYPIIEVEQVYLWPVSTASGETRFHIGVGVMFSN